jgi:hypothetical protein
VLIGDRLRFVREPKNRSQGALKTTQGWWCVSTILSQVFASFMRLSCELVRLVKPELAGKLGAVTATVVVAVQLGPVYTCLSPTRQMEILHVERG